MQCDVPIQFQSSSDPNQLFIITIHSGFMVKIVFTWFYWCHLLINLTLNILQTHAARHCLESICNIFSLLDFKSYLCDVERNE